MSTPDIEELRTRWESDPTPAATLRLARMYRTAGSDDEAVAVLSRALEAHPEETAVRVARGSCQLDLDRPELAVEDLESVAREEPAHILANQLLVDAHARLGDLDRARNRFELFSLLSGSEGEIQALQAMLDLQTRTPAEQVAASETTPAAESSEEAADEEVPPAVGEPFHLPDAGEAETLRVAPRPSASGGRRLEILGPPEPFQLAEWLALDADAHGQALYDDGFFGSSSEGEPGTEGASDAGGHSTVTLGELYRQQGHEDEAASIFRDILARQPGNAEAARALGELEQEKAWPLSADDLLGGGARQGDGSESPDGGASASRLLRSYRERLRGGD